MKRMMAVTVQEVNQYKSYLAEMILHIGYYFLLKNCLEMACSVSADTLVHILCMIPRVSVGSPLRFMLLQLHLRIYSVLSFPYITHPAQPLTSHIHLHPHGEGEREKEREDGKNKRRACGFWRNEQNVYGSN